jgi:hypothetical protein
MSLQSMWKAARLAASDTHPSRRGADRVSRAVPLDVQDHHVVEAPNEHRKPEEWTPRELRHSLVSLLSDAGVPIEDVSRLVGHSSTSVTELVYRHQIRPVIQSGATIMGSALRFAGRPSRCQDCRRRRDQEPATLVTQLVTQGIVEQLRRHERNRL